jgi:hypothetical protein
MALLDLSVGLVNSLFFAFSPIEPALQHPRQMVFIFASNFAFSAASTSTYSDRSVKFLDAAGLSTAIGASDTAGLFGVEALEVLSLPSLCGGAVPL